MASGIGWSSSALVPRWGSLSRLHRSTAAHQSLGHLGEDVDPGADVLAPLGVVGRQRRQGVRPSGLPGSVVGVDRVGLEPEPARLAADLVERDQAVVDVERGVLDPLGRHRGRHLLELAGEPSLLGAVVLGERLGRLQQQHLADEAEDPAAQERVAGGRPPDGDLDGAAVGLVHPVVGDVRAVDREGGDHGAQRLAEGVEGEVARPTALLRQPVELVGQHVQLAGERDLHDQTLLAVDQLG